MKKWKKIMAVLVTGCMLASVAACGNRAEGTSENRTGGSDEKYTIAMLPKLKGENYFDACKSGADEAAEELGVTLLYDAPPQDDATNQRQVNLIEGWVAQGIDALIVSPMDGDALAPTLQKIMDEGVKVVTYDADTIEDCRDLFVNQVDAAGVAKGLLDAAKSDLEAKGYSADNPANLTILSGTETDVALMTWEGEIKKLLSSDEAYDLIKLRDPETDVFRSDGSESNVNEQAAAIVANMGPGEDQYQLAFALSTMGTAALGAQYEAIAVKPDPEKVSLGGLSTPNGVKSYIKDEANPMNNCVLWNCMDLGYLSVQTAVQLLDGTITDDSTTMNAGRLGDRQIEDGKTVVLGEAVIFDISNIDDFNY